MTEHSAEAAYTGQFAHTHRQKFLVSNDAGESFPADLVRSIDVTSDPDLLTQLKSGTLHTVKCPTSGAVYQMAVPVVCHDPSRRVLALVIPRELRWDEFRLRKQLMDDLVEAADALPAYARQFHVIIGAKGFAELEGGSAVIDSEEVTQIASKSQHDLEESKELARKRVELEGEAERIRVEREQLDEIRGRFDRERGQLDEAAEELQGTREELEQLKKALELERQQLEAEKLNAEAAALRVQSGTSETSDESTQVVTDDQFIEVVDVGSRNLGDAESVVQQDVDEVVIADIDADVPQSMSDLVSSSRQSAVKLINDRVIAIAQVNPDRVEKLFDGSPTFFVQLHEVDGYPIVTLLLAKLDAREQIVESVAWTLDPAPDGDHLILDRLRKRTKLRVAFYGPTGKRLRAVEIAAPFATNVEWMLGRAAEMLGKSGRAKYPAARLRFESESFEKLGSMRHNFTRDSFSDAVTPSQVKLAAGIVGYWSKSDTFEYLIANRCFPLEHFREIQRRVALRAADTGIFTNRPMRMIAVEAGVAADEAKLVDLLIANFAETSISIRTNDLDAADSWENWDSLLGLGEELGLPADPDVVELAEVSLKRAQEAEELAERSEAEDEPTRTIEDPRLASPDDSLVIAKRSESTGITYFLPGDAVLDTFDDLASMSREDLELLLNDANGRLEAAQMLIERFGAQGTSRVMEAAETMGIAEVAALAQFVESKAGGLEGELVRSVESGGPHATYIATRALAATKSTTAIPVLIDALQDDKRQGDMERLAEALAQYGDKLMPALTRAIKRDGPKESLVLLLIALEDEVSGTLSTLSKDRSKNLREAAREARQQRESKSA